MRPNAQRSSTGDHRQRNNARWTTAHNKGKQGGGLNAGIHIIFDRNRKCFIEKRFTPQGILAGCAKREIDIMKQLRSVDQDYIVWLEDYFIDYARREASIIMEFCNAGSMDKLILRHMQAGRRKIGESYIWAWFVQLAEALVWCHYGPEKGDGRRRGVWDMIYHRDIKPANIFLHQYESGRYRGEIIAKLGDFGCATSYQRVITGRSSRQASGYTEGYRPPEAPLFNNKSDVWQAGAAIVCLCKLQHVPKPENVAMLFGPGGYYSSQLWECLAKCTESNWERRWDAKEMRRCLKGTYEGILKRGNLKTDGKPLLPGKATVM